MAAQIIYLPWRYAPQMPRVTMKVIESYPQTPESIERAKYAQRIERIAAGLCPDCGTPRSREDDACPTCVAETMAKFDALFAKLTGGVA